jgi:hypothetical protein
MVAGTTDLAALVLRSVLSDELGIPFMSLLCVILGEDIDGCGSAGAPPRAAETTLRQMERNIRVGSNDGIIEAAVVALATWGMVTVSLLVAILVYCICQSCCSGGGGQQGGDSRGFPGAEARCEKRLLLRRFVLKVIILPRPARDKHRENSKKRCIFRRRRGPGILRRPGRQADAVVEESAVVPASPAALAMVDTFTVTKADLAEPARGEASAAEEGSREEGIRRRRGDTDGGCDEHTAAAAAAAAACAVCVERVQVGQRASRLACGHMFHARCLLTWLQRADSCPCCRLRIGDDYQPAHG